MLQLILMLQSLMLQYRKNILDNCVLATLEQMLVKGLQNSELICLNCIKNIYNRKEKKSWVSMINTM